MYVKHFGDSDNQFWILGYFTMSKYAYMGGRLDR
jgi:hypothetical protein